MSDREALTAALNRWYGDGTWRSGDFEVMAPAARERLAQLPETCETCGGTGWALGAPDDRGEHCPSCHGSGKVYPAELVERIADVLVRQYHLETNFPQDAVAVLDALDGETP